MMHQRPVNRRQHLRALACCIGKVEKRLNKQSYKCMHPDCNNMAISSHSQQRERQLRSIAKNGHVYALQRNHYQLAKRLNDQKSALQLKELGIAVASTFPGFCSMHDEKLFAPIDREELVVSDEKQAFLIFFRTFCYEFAQKRRALDFLSLILAECSFLISRDNAKPIEARYAGVKTFFEKDAPFYLDRFFDCLANQDYSGVTTIWKIIEGNIGASSACVFSPLLENYKDYISANYDLPQPALSFNLIPERDRTHIITSWWKEHDDLAKWAYKNVNNEKELERYINLAAFAESEDTCVNPNLWDGEEGDIKEKLLAAMEPNLFRRPLAEVPILLRLPGKVII